MIFEKGGGAQISIIFIIYTPEATFVIIASGFYRSVSSRSAYKLPKENRCELRDNFKIVLYFRIFTSQFYVKDICWNIIRLFGLKLSKYV